MLPSYFYNLGEAPECHFRVRIPGFKSELCPLRYWLHFSKLQIKLPNKAPAIILYKYYCHLTWTPCRIHSNFQLETYTWFVHVKKYFSWASQDFYMRNIKNSALVMPGWFFPFLFWWTDEEQHNQRKYTIQRSFYNLSLGTTTSGFTDFSTYCSGYLFHPCTIIIL